MVLSAIDTGLQLLKTGFASGWPNFLSGTRKTHRSHASPPPNPMTAHNGDHVDMPFGQSGGERQTRLPA